MEYLPLFAALIIVLAGGFLGLFVGNRITEARALALRKTDALERTALELSRLRVLYQRQIDAPAAETEPDS